MWYSIVAIGIDYDGRPVSKLFMSWGESEWGALKRIKGLENIRDIKFDIVTTTGDGIDSDWMCFEVYNIVRST